MSNPQAPVGVFDSGLGGLSVLRVLRHHMRHEHWVYFSDSAHAPYGEKTQDEVTDRSLAITAFLRERHHIKALVVACNTATAAAIATIRAHHPDLLIVGIEPGIKPAVSLSRTRKIGLMATRRTIGSDKFLRLLDSVKTQADFIIQPCDGLALAIESQDESKTRALIALYTSAMGTFGTEIDTIDTLVLGCTHYPLAAQQLHRVVGPSVTLIDPAQGVARHLERMLTQSQQLSSRRTVGQVIAEGTANAQQLRLAIEHWCSPAH